MPVPVTIPDNASGISGMTPQREPRNRIRYASSYLTSSRNWAMTKTLRHMLHTKYIMMVAAQAR